jgi:Transposase DDE domain
VPIGHIGIGEPDVEPQARARQDFAAADFTVDWERRLGICPEGGASSIWTPAVDKRTKAVIKIRFSENDCAVCPSRARCISPQATRKRPRRSLTIRPEADDHAVQAARPREQSPAFAKLYRRRAGIEGTISQGVRACRRRRTRHIGLRRDSARRDRRCFEWRSFW